MPGGSRSNVAWQSWTQAPSRQFRGKSSERGCTAAESRREVSMAKEFSVVIEQDTEGYYIASVPALRGCHTQAKSLDELMVRIREAVELCLEVQGDNIERLDFIGVQKITVV